NEKSSYECEYRYRKNGKEKILWSKGVIIFEKGKPVSMKGTVMDITDRHYMLKRLERNEELYKQAQKLTHIGNWTWDLQTNEIVYSDELGRIYGLEQNGKTSPEVFLSFVHPNDKKKVREKLDESLRTNTPHTIDFEITHKDGSPRFIRRNVEVLIDEKGKPYKIAGTAQDITKEVLLNKEIKEREEKLEELNISLNQKNIALERSNKELTSFSYVASHDLQEPLRKIKTFSNLILEKEQNMSSEGKEWFERIMVSAGRMQKLIEDLLSFSRTQIYENILNPVDLNSILGDIKILHAESISEGRLILNNDTLPVITGVQFQLQQLMENLISNSIKYGKPGEAVEINIHYELVQGKNVPSLIAAENKKYHRICITDNGIGFDQQYADRIFEIFQRLHGKNEYSGTGIGLSICKKIVENHLGHISAEGKINEGATFTIYLPE
ncbi:MAG TPA: ATP-binding protein, partial [Bacteroidia bacterium]